MAICPACERTFDRLPGDTFPARCPHCFSRVLGVYCDLALIGSGAMGEVYQARRPNMGNRTVAIKIPKEPESRACNRFEREIAASARLRHENIVCAFDRGEADGRPYLVMEYVAGCQLSDLVDSQHPLSPVEAARIVRQVAAGLAHAAQHHIVNRDIKPDNILIAADGTAKILDYGLALIAELDGPADRVTRNGTLLGTPGFLAPEQAHDPRDVSIAADVYGLGCTAHYMLTRRPPFSAKDSLAILKQHAVAPRPSVRSKRPDVDAELDELIQRMMAVAPQERPAPRDVVQQLDRMIPRLSNVRPSFPSSASGRIDVRCPGCQQVFHLRSDMVGKRMLCPNKLCGHRFTVEPQLGATVSYADTSEATPVVPVLDPRLDQGEPLEAEALEAEPLAAEPLEAEPLEVEALEAEPVEAEPVEAEPVAEAVPTLGAMDLPPIQRDIPTVQAVAGDIDTPHQVVQIGTASAVPSPADINLPPPLQWPAREGSEPQLRKHERPPIQVSHGTPGPPDLPTSPKQLKRKRRGRLMPWVVVGLTGLMLAASGVAGWQVYRTLNPPPEVQWERIREAYANKNWEQAIAGFNKFQKDFPEHPHVYHVPFYVSMSEVGKLVYSDATDTEASLRKMEELFREYRDNPAYKLHLADLYMAFKRLVERFTEAANREPFDVAKVERARVAFNLLTTVAESMEDPWVPEATQKLSAYMDETEVKVRFRRAFKDVVALLQKVQTADPETNPDDVYAQVAALETRFPELLSNNEFLAARDAAYRAEPKRVRYVQHDEPDDGGALAYTSPPASEQSRAADLFVIWDDRTDAAPEIRRRQVLTALSRGVLYVFDARGNFLWARRLGVDSHRLPLHMPATTTSPAALIAVSTEDNTLLSLDAEHEGRVLWQYHAGDDITAPLTIVKVSAGKQRGLLPTADGNIDVLELVLGKQLGRFETGYPLANVGGGYDPANKLAYFPADSRRMFAINVQAIDDPKQPACQAVLFTEHASGALRSAPTIVDRYLILSEATELERMNLRVFGLTAFRMADPRSTPIDQVELKGWSWFSALSSPDRITLVTDAGDLGVFGLNLDNEDESIYRIVDEKSATIPLRDPFRSLAVDSDERFLWIMAGGTLRKLRLDILSQRIHTLWPKEDQPAEVTGIPLHESQLDERGDQFFLGLMAADGSRYDFVAVDAKHGKRLWQRQLGVKLFGDPLVIGQRVLLIDQSGRTLLLDPESSQHVYQPSHHASLPAGADPRQVMRIQDYSGKPLLVVPLNDGAQLALSYFDTTREGALTWQIVALPEELQGRPGICGDFLVAPGKRGTLLRVPLKPGIRLPINPQPDFWMPGDNKDPGPETAAVYPVPGNPQAILLAAARQSIRRLEIYEQQNTTAWRAVGKEFVCEAPLVGQVLIVGDRALVIDEAGNVYAFDVSDPSQRRGLWKLGGRPTSEPFLRGGKLMVVVDGRRLVAIDPAHAPADEQPLWSTEPLAGRIRGQPVLTGDELLVADESCRVTAVRLTDGTAAWTVNLPARIGPAAAAVAFGADRILVPLADGTFSIVPKPAQKQLAATRAE